MKTKLLTALLLALISNSSVSAQSSITLPWTSNDQKTIEARFIGVGAQSVLIEKDGVVFNVAFERLSPHSIAQARLLGGRIGQSSPAQTTPSAMVSTPSRPVMVPQANPVRRSAPKVVAYVSPSVARKAPLPTGLRRLPSNPEWSFLRAYQDGADVVVHHTIATVFGHDTKLDVKDPNDNGRCASGRGTWANPGLLGCALPVSVARRSTLGSPFARLSGLSWFSQVEVTYQGRTITVQLIDNGPSAPKSGDSVPAGIDLTPAACLALGIPLENIRANRVSFPVSFRVLGAGQRMYAAN